MPSAWHKAGHTYHRNHYVDDTEHVPADVVNASAILDEALSQIRDLGVTLIVGNERIRNCKLSFKHNPETPKENDDE